MTTPFPFSAGQVLTAAQMNAITELAINDQTASYVLVVGDAGKRVIMNNAGATTITVPNSVFSTSQVVEIVNKGAGVCTVTAGSGATVSTSGSLVIPANGSGRLLALSASAFIFETTEVRQIAIFNETQASGTNGGASTQAFKKRTLNTTVSNTIAGCSISSSVVTLANPGTYYFRGSTPGYECFGIKSKIRNTTASTDVGIGQNVACSVGSSPGGTSSVVECVATITASTTFELQSRETDIKATNGLGGAYSFGVSEIYSELYIERLS